MRRVFSNRVAGVYLHLFVPSTVAVIHIRDGDIAVDFLELALPERR
jgi:hypothetical protein